MREVAVKEITQVVRDLFIDANVNLGEDVKAALEQAIDKEESEIGKEVLAELIENARIAKTERMPMCQDTGLPVVFVELGQEVYLTGGDLFRAINAGIRQGTHDGFLRPSLCHCLSRKNTRDNTPPVIHLEMVPGDQVKITVLPKGGGSENMSGLKILAPAAGLEGVKEFVVQQVKESGGNPCPPIIVGVGIGGSFDQAPIIAKKALLRPVGSTNADPELATIEADLLGRINDLGIGPSGYGGRVTALAVHVAMIPCHIASLPVAINIQCHVHRYKEGIL
jgi:fumarate hydratase subunit alpha